MGAETNYDVNMMFPTAIKVVLKVLDHQNIRSCLVGEFALNYYNVPDVVHDVELCVPDDRLDDAGAALLQTGLCKMDNYDNINPHNEYKSGFLRLTTTNWLPRPVSFVVFPASFCGLQPLHAYTIRPGECTRPDMEFSKEILEAIDEEDIKNFTFPVLAPFLTGLVRRYLDKEDDMAAVAVEHLVDGMNLDEAWCREQLAEASPAVIEIAERFVRGKKSRIAYYQDNTVTCMVADEGQASKLPKIPGYQKTMES